MGEKLSMASAPHGAGNVKKVLYFLKRIETKFSRFCFSARVVLYTLSQSLNAI